MFQAVCTARISTALCTSCSLICMKIRHTADREPSHLPFSSSSLPSPLSLHFRLERTGRKWDQGRTRSMFAFFQNSTRCVGFRSQGARAFFFFSRFFGELRISPPLLNFRQRVVGYAMPVRHERCVEFLKREDSMDRKRSSIWDPRMIQEDRFRGGSAELFPGCSLLIRNVYTNRARRIYIKCIDDRIGLTFASCISLSTVHLDGNPVES